MITTSLIGYVGPGPGLTMIGAFIALLGTIAVAIFTALLWPIRMLIRKIKGTPPDAQDAVSGNEASIVAMDDAAVTSPATEQKTHS